MRVASSSKNACAMKFSFGNILFTAYRGYIKTGHKNESSTQNCKRTTSADWSMPSKACHSVTRGRGVCSVKEATHGEPDSCQKIEHWLRQSRETWRAWRVLKILEPSVCMHNGRAYDRDCSSLPCVMTYCID